MEKGRNKDDVGKEEEWKEGMEAVEGGGRGVGIKMLCEGWQKGRFYTCLASLPRHPTARLHAVVKGTL